MTDDLIAAAEAGAIALMDRPHYTHNPAHAQEDFSLAFIAGARWAFEQAAKIAEGVPTDQGADDYYTSIGKGCGALRARISANIRAAGEVSK